MPLLEWVQQSREQKLGAKLQLPASAWWDPNHAKPLQPARDGARSAEEAPKYWSPLFQASKMPTAPHQLLVAMQDPWGTSLKIPTTTAITTTLNEVLVCTTTTTTNTKWSSCMHRHHHNHNNKNNVHHHQQQQQMKFFCAPPPQQQN